MLNRPVDDEFGRWWNADDTSGGRDVALRLARRFLGSDSYVETLIQNLEAEFRIEHKDKGKSLEDLRRWLPVRVRQTCMRVDDFNEWFKSDGRERALKIARTSNVAEAEDVVQEVGFSLFKAYAGGKTLDDIKRELGTSVRRECIDFARKRSNRAMAGGDVAATYMAEDVKDVSRHPKCTSVDLPKPDQAEYTHLCGYVDTLLSSAIAGNQLRSVDLDIWYRVRRQGYENREVVSAYQSLRIRLSSSDVTHAVKKVDGYLQARFAPNDLATDVFTPRWLSERYGFIVAVAASLHVFSTESLAQPPLLCLFIADRIRKSADYIPFLDEKPDNHKAVIIADILCKMILKPDWHALPFACRPEFKEKIHRADHLKADASRLNEQVKPEEANLLKAKAIGIYEKILTTLVNEEASLDCLVTSLTELARMDPSVNRLLDLLTLLAKQEARFTKEDKSERLVILLNTLTDGVNRN